MEGIRGSEIKILSTYRNNLEQRMPTANLQGISVTVIIVFHFQHVITKKAYGPLPLGSLS